MWGVDAFWSLLCILTGKFDGNFVGDPQSHTRKGKVKEVREGESDSISKPAKS